MNLLENALWLILTMALLAWLQMRLHQEVQLFFLLITRNPKLAILLFSLVFLPGVFLHEISHYLTAKLLRVRTGRMENCNWDLWRLLGPIQSGKVSLVLRPCWRGACL